MKSELMFFSSSSTLDTNLPAIVEEGYCWQYVSPERVKGPDNFILCELFEKGDVINLASLFKFKDSEVYIAGSKGCKVKPIENFDINNYADKLAKYRKFYLFSLQLLNNVFTRRHQKVWTKTEQALLSQIKLAIIDFKRQPAELQLNNKITFANPFSTISFTIEKQLSSYVGLVNQSNAKDSRQRSQTFLAPKETNNQFIVEASEYLYEFFGSLSYSYIYSTIHNVTNEGKCLDIESISKALAELGIKYHVIEKEADVSAINQDGKSCISFVFRNNILCEFNRGLAIPKDRLDQCSFIVIEPLVTGEITFWSFLKEIGKSKKNVTLILCLSLVIQILTLAVPLLFQQIIDKVINQNNPTILPVLITVMITSAVLAGTFRVSRQLIVFDVADRADERFSEYVIRHLLRLDYRFFAGTKRGDLAGRIQEVSSVRAFFTGPALSTLLDLVFAVTYLSILLLYSPKLTVVAFSPIPIYLGIVAWGAPYYKKLVKSRANKRSLLVSFLLEVISGIESVKLQGFTDQAVSRWRNKFEDQQKTSLTLTSLGSVFSEISGLCTQLSGILILAVGSGLVLGGELTLGELIAFRIISGFLTTPLVRLSSLWQTIQDTQVSLERVNKIVNYPLESENLSELPLISSEDAIVFRNVKFKYNQDYVLNDVSFRIKNNNKTAIVGRSGSGKSTLIKLITGLYKYQAGEILIGNVNQELLSASSIRKQIYCVPQESHFIGGTLEDNIMYGYQDCNVEQIKNALKLACFDEILQTKLNINSLVEEGGSNFSGGQRQRIALARMILRKPQLIILDEATSALDSITERNFLDNLCNYLPNSTVIFITHRVNSTKIADQIILMKNGVVNDKGTFSSLKNTSSEFQSMLSSSQL